MLDELGWMVSGGESSRPINLQDLHAYNSFETQDVKLSKDDAISITQLSCDIF